MEEALQQDQGNVKVQELAMKEFCLKVASVNLDLSCRTMVDVLPEHGVAYTGQSGLPVLRVLKLLRTHTTYLQKITAKEPALELGKLKPKRSHKSATA